MCCRIDVQTPFAGHDAPPHSSFSVSSGLNLLSFEALTGPEATTKLVARSAGELTSYCEQNDLSEVCPGAAERAAALVGAAIKAEAFHAPW